MQYLNSINQSVTERATNGSLIRFSSMVKTLDVVLQIQMLPEINAYSGTHNHL